jgi:hypothetical protein
MTNNRIETKPLRISDNRDLNEMERQYQATISALKMERARLLKEIEELRKKCAG